jgi:hypothetical protein
MYEEEGESAVVVKVEFGMYGGAPPNRRWFGTGPTWSVPNNMTVRTLWESVRHAASLKHIRTAETIELRELWSENFHPKEDDLDKTLSDMGVKNHLYVRISNGAVD